MRHRDLATATVQADEIWAFVGAKQRRAVRAGDGDIWTFTAIDADSKLMISWVVGPRSFENAIAFMKDVRSRLTKRIQLTTDGHPMYEVAVREAFKWDEVNWAMLVKQYGTVEPEKVVYYNYCRPHQTLTQEAGTKTTPAMAAGLAERVWSAEDIVARMDPESAQIG